MLKISCHVVPWLSVLRIIIFIFLLTHRYPKECQEFVKAGDDNDDDYIGAIEWK